MAVLLVVCLVLCVRLSSAALSGWDLGGELNENIIKCLKSKNDAGFITFPAMDKYSAVDANVCSNLALAASEGIVHRDVMYIPCPTCGQSASVQFTMMLDNLEHNCSTSWSKRVWLNMASHSLWPTPWREAGYLANQRFFEDMVSACVSAKGISCGILSSPSEWKYTLGSTSYSYAPSLDFPLWYENIDEKASFSDFVQFGGFTVPYAKRYHYDVSVCNASVVYESWAPVW